MFPKLAPLLFLLTQLADLALTKIGVSFGIRELNPLGFTWQFIAIKVVGALAVAFALHHYAGRLGRLVWLPVGVMLPVLVWNATQVILCAI